MIIKTNNLTRLVIIVGLFALSIVALNIVLPKKAEAVSASDWRAGRIIDDAVFFNNNSMSVQQIQDFLNAKVPGCDRWNPTRFTYAGKPYGPPYTCLKEYQENPTTHENNIGRFNPDGSPYNVPGGWSAAQIIKDAADSYGINPQVLIVMLQKETAIVTDTWAAGWQYDRAMGYGCPDTGPNGTANCNNKYYGFYNQVGNAAWQLKRYTTNPNEYNFKAGVTRNILWQVGGVCGSSPVYLENAATAALYNYTPYQPNQAALNNLYGIGDNCSAYGNRNFWRIFNDWFGNTRGVNYSWAIESFTYTGGDNVLSINTPEKVILKARNTGVQPWYNHGNNPARLGTWNPPDQTSTLISNGIRFATVTESVVMPGQVGTFEFDLYPTKLGTFVQAMNIVSENNEWSTWPGFSPTITVNSGYSYEIQNLVYEKGTGLMDPGSTQLVTLIVKNTGSKTWSKNDGPKIRLATWGPGRSSMVGNNWISSNRVTEMNENIVNPGQYAGFQFYVKVPTSGNYYENLNIVAEGQEWLPYKGLTLYLEGKSYAWAPIWHYHSTGTANIARNTKFNLTVKVKNTGTFSWYKSSGPKIRLATISPMDRGSALYSPTWIRDTRPAEIEEEVVNPGQEGTFTFQATTPNAIGPRSERFSMIAEGYTWFNDPGFSIYVNVTP